MRISSCITHQSYPFKCRFVLSHSMMGWSSSGYFVLIRHRDLIHTTVHSSILLPNPPAAQRATENMRRVRCFWSFLEGHCVHGIATASKNDTSSSCASQGLGALVESKKWEEALALVVRMWGPQS